MIRKTVEIPPDWRVIGSDSVPLPEDNMIRANVVMSWLVQIMRIIKERERYMEIGAWSDKA
jgi:hypothetical protein